MKRILLFSVFFVSQCVFASTEYWSELDANYEFEITRLSGQKHEYSGRRMQLDMTAFKEHMTGLSNRSGSETIVSLPTPDDQYLTFRIEEDSVLSPALAARYPEIKTWKITGIDNESISGRIDVGPRGFHGAYYLNGELIVIDPEYQIGQPQTELYTVVRSRAQHNTMSDTGFRCTTEEVEEDHSQPTPMIANKPSLGLRTYRLALAVTGEYTQLFGGTKALALAGVTTTINRINQIFERDFNVRLELIDNNDELLFLSPSLDPYMSQDAADMVSQNMTTINEIIGSENYDIGHVFGTGKIGGLAFIGSVCGQYKAGGVTGSNTPEGESFNIDYVAHEIGHQLGALHTFNGTQQSCTAYNRMPSAAVEPGSGSTIMGYAGICGDDNLQLNSDPYFHGMSITQVLKYTSQGNGASCGSVGPTINNTPQVDAGSDYVIPEQTPFRLMGSATDVDNQQLTHSWEQVDVGTATDLYSDLGDNPLFRVWKPHPHPTRYFPRLKDLLRNQLAVGELLPSTARDMIFSLLVRDNQGGTGMDKMQISVVATGEPFAITSDDIAEELKPGDSFDLKWNVAGTHLPPINCQFVDVGFINDKGKYTPILRNTPNDGREIVQIAERAKAVRQEHIKLSCSDNIFFAVSNTKHTVPKGLPTLVMDELRLVVSENGEQTLVCPMLLSEKAKEEIVVNYQVTSTVTKEKSFSGEAIIAVGQSQVDVEIPVIETTLEEAEKATHLVIQLPNEPQFKLEATHLAASPELSNVSSGGGGFNIVMVMLLLLGYFAKAGCSRRFC